MSKVMRRDPFERTAIFLKKMNKLMDEFFTEDFFDRAWQSLSYPRNIEVTDKDQEIVIQANLPNIDSKNLDVHVDENTVTLKGTYSEQTKNKNRNYYVQENRTGSFQQTIPLTCTIVPEKSQASYKNGTLKLTLPKSKISRTGGYKVKID